MWTSTVIRSRSVDTSLGTLSVVGGTFINICKYLDDGIFSIRLVTITLSVLCNVTLWTTSSVGLHFARAFIHSSWWEGGNRAVSVNNHFTCCTKNSFSFGALTVATCWWWFHVVFRSSGIWKSDNNEMERWMNTYSYQYEDCRSSYQYLKQLSFQLFRLSSHRLYKYDQMEDCQDVFQNCHGKLLPFEAISPLQ